MAFGKEDLFDSNERPVLEAESVPTKSHHHWKPAPFKALAAFLRIAVAEKELTHYNVLRVRSFLLRAMLHTWTSDVSRRIAGSSLLLSRSSSNSTALNPSEGSSLISASLEIYVRGSEPDLLSRSEGMNGCSLLGCVSITSYFPGSHLYERLV